MMKLCNFVPHSQCLSHYWEAYHWLSGDPCGNPWLSPKAAKPEMVTKIFMFTTTTHLNQMLAKPLEFTVIMTHPMGIYGEHILSCQSFTEIFPLMYLHSLLIWLLRFCDILHKMLKESLNQFPVNVVNTCNLGWNNAGLSAKRVGHEIGSLGEKISQIIISAYFCQIWSHSKDSKWQDNLVNSSPLDKMPTISRMLFSDAFSWMKSFVFWLNFTQVCSLWPNWQ